MPPKSPLETQYWRHMRELRLRLLVTLAVFTLGFTLGFFFFQPLVNLFLSLFRLDQVKIILSSPFQVLNLAINTGLITGLLLSAPIFIFNLFQFIKPALKPKQRKALPLFIFISLFLFITGFSTGLLMMRWLVSTLIQTFSLTQIDNYWDISLFISQILLTAVILGLAFQFPLLTFLLAKVGLIRTKTLQQNRPLAITAILIFVALLPPTDALSLIIMSLALIILYETTIFLLKNKKGGE